MVSRKPSLPCFCSKSASEQTGRASSLTEFLPVESWTVVKLLSLVIFKIPMTSFGFQTQKQSSLPVSNPPWIIIIFLLSYQDSKCVLLFWPFKVREYEAGGARGAEVTSCLNTGWVCTFWGMQLTVFCQPSLEFPGSLFTEKLSKMYQNREG